MSEKLHYLRTGHQDPFDFFTALSFFPENDQMSIASSMFLTTTSKLSCVHNKNHFNEREESPEFYISVNVPHEYDGLQCAIEDAISGTEFLSDWRCQYCDLYGGTKSKRFEDHCVPKYLIIKLNRALETKMEYDIRTQEKLSPQN